MFLKLGTHAPVDRVMARIRAPMTARFLTSPASTGKVWKIRVVGTRKISSKEAPAIVFSPNTNKTDPPINMVIAQASKNSDKGDAMPLDAM